MTKKEINLFRELLGEENVRENEPMAVHTSFRVGGPADLFCRVGSLRELTRVLEILREIQEPYFLLGKGTNLLVGDRGYRGCIITMTSEFPKGRDGSEFCGIEVAGSLLRAGAGEMLSQLSLTARDHGLSGLEFAAGIPGTLGGALVMNAGAYGSSMEQVVTSAWLLMPDGRLCTADTKEMHFGYRTSLLKEIPAIALQATLSLTPADPEQISASMKELGKRRSEKQPLEYPSAGSTFKRPEGLYAGKLIMDAGLKGFSVGGAAVSEKHCGFVINRDHATAADIRAVISEVRKKVYETSGILLEEEIISLGEF